MMTATQIFFVLNKPYHTPYTVDIIQGKSEGKEANGL